ncbi:hypothetical protein D917_03728 [Trichinella nativa]|uniref:Peptidase S1 domain-containing protein n=1 Tax=Trichinella nativa TaxID=6335 RepID=A0A1Y3E6Y5_9BILA|nr:hypothetical protein D917_03728 [Trichinella nativa]
MVSTPLFKLGKYFPFELFDEYEETQADHYSAKSMECYFLYGVSSFFPYFAYPGSVIGYTKVTYFIDWIKETTKCDATDTCL